jgi:hypothetical protein
MISLISTRMRILYGIIAATIALSSVVTYPEYGFSVTEAIMIALCVLAACYEERWSISEDSGAVVFRQGLVFLARSKKFPYADIAEVRVETFEKGFRKTSWTRVSIVIKDESTIDTDGGASDGKTIVVETMPTKKAAKLTAFAERIRGFLKA